MALKHIDYGSLATSSDLNDNFEYLEGLSVNLENSKADNNAVVHLTTAETISGNKTFGDNTTTTFTNTSNVVLAGSNTISGSCTISGNRTISGSSTISGNVELTGNTTLNGNIIFGENIVLPYSFRYVISHSGTGTTWKRVWADGWCEQGGYKELTTAGTHETTIDIDAMSGDTYDVQITISYSGTSNMDYIPFVRNMTKTSFTVYHNSNLPGRYCRWYVCGFEEVRQ